MTNWRGSLRTRSYTGLVMARLGAGSWTERVQALTEPRLELIGAHEGER
jgi:hypothetical protein